MKRRNQYLAAAALLALCGLIPAGGEDVAELLPAQALVIWERDGLVELSCDCGVSAEGATLEQALDALCAAAPGSLFLDTAEQIVVKTQTQSLLRQAALCQRLRPAARLCLCPGELPDAAQAAVYLHAHESDLTLGKARAALLAGLPIAPPRLWVKEGRMRLEQ